MTKEQAFEYIKTECERADVPFEICLHNLKTGHRLKRYPEGTKFTDWVRTEVVKLQPYGTKTISEIVGGKSFFAAWGLYENCYTNKQKIGF